MSWFGKVKELFTSAPVPGHALYTGEGEVGRVLAALRGVNDPEIGKDIVHLGMIRAVDVADGRARVVLSPTTAGCPLIGWLVDQASEKIRGLGLEPEVSVVTEPPWTPADIESV